MPINRELSQFGSFVEVANSTKLGIVNPNVGIGTTNPTVKVEVHGDIKTVSGKVGVQTTASADLQVYGQTQLDQLNVLGVSTFSSAIDFNGGIDISGGSGLIVSSAKISDLTDNRVVIAGNSGELEDDANLTFNGSTLSVGVGLDVDGHTELDNLNVSGVSTFSSAVDINANLDVDGYTELDDLNVAGVSTFVGAINANGNLDVDGHTDLDYVAVSAGATFASLVDVNGGLQANTAKIEDLTNNRVVLAGVGGELEDDGNFTFTGETVNIGAQLTVSGVSTFSSSVQAASFVTGASGAAIGVNTNTISGPAEMFIDPAAVGDNTGVVRIKGDLYVDGTTTQINSETLTIADFVVGIASTATTDSLADGAGINIGPNNTFKYDHTNTSLKSSENLNVASGKTYKVNGTDVLSATTLGSNVVNSSLTSVGTLGALTVSGDVSIADKIVHTGDTNTAIRFPANDTFTVETVGSERVRITSDGKVGIGLTNPSKTLSILSSQSVMLQLEGTSTTARIGFKVPNTSNSPTIGVSDEEDLQFRTGNNERVRITSDGKVGIGLTNPSSDLNVIGEIKVGSGGEYSVNTSRVQHNVRITSPLFAGRGSDGYVDIKGDSGATSFVRILDSGSVGIGTDNPSSILHVTKSGDPNVIQHNSADDSLIRNNSLRFRFSDGEGALINAVRPSGGSKADTHLVFGSGGSTERLRITSAGSVGINSDAPARTLDVYATSSTMVAQFKSGTSTNSSLICFANPASNADQVRIGSLGSDFIASTNYAERLRINSAGLVGIGTDNPVAKVDIITGTGDGTQNEANCLRLRQRGNSGNAMTLQVGVNPTGVGGGNQGYAYLQGRFWGGDNNPILLNPKGGNVGIGRTFAHVPLDVNGDTILRAAAATTQGDLTRKYGFTGHNNTVNPQSYIAGVADQTHWYQGFGLVFGTVRGSDVNDTLGVERMRISSDGKVGIGSDNPQNALDVAGDVKILDNSPRIHLHDANAADISNVSGGFETFDMSGNRATYFGAGMGNGGNIIEFGTNNTFRAIITSAGLVGIGEQNPLNPLHILVDTNSTQTFTETTNGGGIFLESNSSSGAGNYGAAINFTRLNGSSHRRKAAIVPKQFTGDGESIGLSFFTANGNYSTNSTVGEVFTLHSNGNVGINSTSPAVKLDIRSTDAIRVPVGTTGERPTGAAGYIRYNSSIASYEGHNGSEWAGIGGAAEVETAVSSTSATTCESFAKASYRSASIVAQITQGSSYQVGNYLLIHDGTTATLVEESAVATGDMLGTFTATISGSNVVFQVNMNSASSATVTTMMTKVSIP